MKKAIYPGSFDPITNGHLDIIHRALRLFDGIHIAVTQNADKNAFFSIDERIRLMKDVLKDVKGVTVDSFDGLLAEYADEKKIYTIIRGLRAVSDFDFEFQMSLTNRHLNSKIESIFLMTDGRYSYLSSSLVRQVANLNGPISDFVPYEVEEALKKKGKK